ncbi:MAG: acetyl-coenzyme-A carboxylase [Chaenotheca gracillima]|nr:MAG: acetyl-coenzyme-A carboxylase [Chaenotheca gracillima]
MGSADEPPSSPAGAFGSSEEALAYYKSQYEQLESELADFQASSRELEAELEKDVEASEKREHTLRQKVEGLGYEVEEWKSKTKHSKTEAGAAQATLQKEITTLRDSNRTMQLKLRDIEVANDDFERQARNTTSSLEDLESKYNVAIERGVMLEAEIQSGEQEREALRIETQRLREELSDLKIEAEINLEKLQHADLAPGRRVQQIQSEETPTMATRPRSPSDTSPATTTSSPTVSTPPRPKSASTTISETLTPPSPPISETSATGSGAAKVPRPLVKLRSPAGADTNITPRPSHLPTKSSRHSRGPSTAMGSGIGTPFASNRNGRPRQSGLLPPNLPSSSSLRQIRGLIGQMEKLEKRVHSARSKLPAPVHTPERASPRNGSALGHHIPASVTMRSHKKRTGGSNISAASSVTGAHRDDRDITPLSTKHVSRISMGGGIAPPPPPDKQTGGGSRPSSRASLASRSSISAASNGYQRPSSRTSMSGARTPLGHYSSSTVMDSRRPRSSIGGSYASTHGGGGHAHSSSVSGSSGERDEFATTPTPRRTTLSKHDFGDRGGSAIPTPAALSRRQSGGLGTSSVRRTSSGTAMREQLGEREKEREREMGPPERRRKLSGVGETY